MKLLKFTCPFSNSGRGASPLLSHNIQSILLSYNIQSCSSLVSLSRSLVAQHRRSAQASILERPTSHVQALSASPSIKDPFVTISSLNTSQFSCDMRTPSRLLLSHGLAPKPQRQTRSSSARSRASPPCRLCCPSLSWMVSRCLQAKNLRV
jgi:hypothetical protein